LLGSANAAACGKGKVLYEDTFETLDPSWELVGAFKDAVPGPGGLTADVTPGRSFAATRPAGTNPNVEICATFTVKSAKETPDFFALSFWAHGDIDYWAVSFTSKGNFVVNRYEGDKPLVNVTAQVANPTLLSKTGPNEVSVKLVADKGTFQVTGKEIGSFTGGAPSADSLFGFVMRAGKENSGPTPFVLKRVELREATP
jgi:hypothetical protein